MFSKIFKGAPMGIKNAAGSSGLDEGRKPKVRKDARPMPKKYRNSVTSLG